MSGRRQVERHRRSLAEIREIMNSMKTLAYMETRKLIQALSARRALSQSIELAAADFVASFPESVSHAGGEREVFLLVGSERGFCGDFNESLIRWMQAMSGVRAGGGTPRVIAVGHKLCSRLTDDPRISITLDGVGVAEELEGVLTRVVDALVELQSEFGALGLTAVHHDPDTRRVVTRELLPAFRDISLPARDVGVPLLLNTPPARFFVDLVDQYLFAALHEIFCASLMAENQQRADHLESAIRHLDEEAVALRRRSNTLRQEEIVEEIEVILLSASGRTTREPV